MSQLGISHFDREFEIVQNDLVRMSQLVDQAIKQSMMALLDRNLSLGEEVVKNDEQINLLRFKVAENCLTLIATRQPAARDLRAVVASMNIVVEMERMGDHAAGIAKTVILMSEEPLLKIIKKIPRMSDLSRRMLADCTQAFLQCDEGWAREIAAQDESMDRLYKAVFDKLIEVMANKPDMVMRATYLMWTAHNLERIADRVTNIAEQIIFMTTGDMRELKAGIE